MANVICQKHGVEMYPSKFRQGDYYHKLPDGTSCNLLPRQPRPQQGYETFQKQGQKINDRMSKEEWAAKDEKTNKNILLQVAFKAAVELCTAKVITFDTITNQALAYHEWLLAQTQEAKKPVQLKDAITASPDLAEWASTGYMSEDNIPFGNEQ